MTAQTQTTVKAATKATTKAAGNTPAKTKAATAAKVATKPEVKAVAGKVTNKAVVEKATTKPARKGHVFALVAGMVKKIEHKAMKNAINYHVSKGNLARTPAGIALTQQGAALWTKERIEGSPDKFQEIAAFVHGGACPKEFAGQPVAQVAEKTQFPNLLYWGSFSSMNMRQAFAAIWSK